MQYLTLLLTIFILGPSQWPESAHNIQVKYQNCRSLETNCLAEEAKNRFVNLIEIGEHRSTNWY